MKLTNEHNISLSMAVYLATDDYDYEPDTISATTLIKPIRQVLLTQRLSADQKTLDLSSLVKSSGGSSIHAGIEHAWKTNYKEAMQKLGYPDDVINAVVINPDPSEDLTYKIPIYMERRSYREIAGQKISGKFDFIGQGRLEDFKTTSTFTYTKGNKDDDYRLQGSIYKWLNSDVVTEDVIAIQFYFTDWKAGLVGKSDNYPKSAVLEHQVPLMSEAETENYIVGRINQLNIYKNAPELEIPLCTPKELWMDAPVYKYYIDPNKTTRCAKNGTYASLTEANNRLAQEGRGIVKEIKSKAKACNYCMARPICSQYQNLLSQGLVDA